MVPSRSRPSDSAAERAMIKPRIILHGGAGNITRANLPPELWKRYRKALLRILRSTAALLDPPPAYRAPHSGPTDSAASHGADALTAAVHAVTQLENDPLFNAGVGAVFNREGRVELEAGVMVSRGYRKRGVGVSGLKHVRSPVGLAAEVLRRGDEDDGGGGAQGHVQLNGEAVERLAREWGLEMCEESVFYTRRRWEEHKRGLEREKQACEEEDGDCEAFYGLENNGGRAWGDGEPGWNGIDYLPQGTVGCVVLDRDGTLAVATSTGGMTNKLPGRIGDTPTLGAGMWAEEWLDCENDSQFSHANGPIYKTSKPLVNIPQWAADTVSSISGLDPFGIISKCLPLPSYRRLSLGTCYHVPCDSKRNKSVERRRGVAVGGTGNGDYFLRFCAVRTAAARARFASDPLTTAVEWMAGPDGELQRSAGDRWAISGDGEGGIIGIELKDGKGIIAAAFNRAMFRAWIDDDGVEKCMVFREEY